MCQFVVPVVGEMVPGMLKETFLSKYDHYSVVTLASSRNRFSSTEFRITFNICD
jgi:hypothetical protein